VADARLGQHELERLLQVGRALVSELDLEAVLNQVLEVARELTGARYAALGILDEKKEELERFLFVGIDEKTRRVIGPLPRGRGILGELIRRPEPLRLHDVSEHPHSYGFPTGHPVMRSFLGVPVTIHGEVFGNLYLAEKTGGDFDASDEDSVLILAEWASIAIRNARLYERVEGRREELERAVRGLEATTAIALAVGGETDVDRVIELIVKRGRALVDARSLLILVQDRDELRVAGAAGEVPDTVRSASFPIEGSVSGKVFRSARPERVGDLTSRMNFRLGAFGLVARTGLLVPLVFHGRPQGVLAAFDRGEHGPRFDTEDEHLLTSFAASAATALATAQSVEADRLQHAIEASEAERGRWARELHDQTLQELGALKMLLETAGRSDRAELTDRAFAQAIEQIDFSIRGLQSLITELRPPALDELGIAPAVETLAQRTAQLSGLDIELDVRLAHEQGGSKTRLAAELESAAYRLVQEALNNVVKHAGAGRVAVEIIEANEGLTIRVRDNGRGFDPEQADGGFGLLGMRERVALLGGQLEIDSAEGRGTTLTARLPVRRADGQAA
jgi:signal transduction histidine kinase